MASQPDQTRTAYCLLINLDDFNNAILIADAAACGRDLLQVLEQ